MSQVILNMKIFYIYWKATDSAKNISYTVQEVKITDNTAPIITVYDVSGYAASDNNVTVFNVDLPQITDNISIGLGDGSGGTIRLEYKIFDYNFPDVMVNYLLNGILAFLQMLFHRLVKM